MEMIVHLHPDIFELVKNGKKDVEVRVNDEKRQKLKIGDKLIFLKRPEEVADYYSMERIHRPELTKEEYINDMQRFYSKEEQEEYGIVCILYEK